MNKMVNEGFAEPVENPALTKLMKAWESKQARVAKQASGFGLMAVSLAACNSSSGGGGGGGNKPDPETEGNIFNLTTGADTPLTLESAGDSGILGDIFNAVLGLGNDGLLGVQTLQTPDILVGTDEEDVLNADLNGTGAGGEYARPSISDIEIYFLTPFETLVDTDADENQFGGSDAGLDLGRASGYEQLWMIDNNSSDLDLVNVGEVAVLGLWNVTGGDRATYDVEYTSAAIPELLASGQTVVAIGVGTSAESGLVELDITAPFDEGDNISTLTLDVSDTVRLYFDNDGADMSIFNIVGSGVTELKGEDSFENLEELDSTGYEGDLTLDVSGSEILTSVETGGGDDFITVLQDVLQDDLDDEMDVLLSVDLGGGVDILEIASESSDWDYWDNYGDDYDPGYDDFNGDDISALDFTGGVTGVENIAFRDHVHLGGQGGHMGGKDAFGPMGGEDDPTVLDLEGVSNDLEAIWFFDGIDGGEDGKGSSSDSYSSGEDSDPDLTLANSPVDDLIINSTYIDDLSLDVGNVVNLTVNVTGDEGEDSSDYYPELDLDDIVGDSLQTLTLTQTTPDGEVGGVIWLDIESDEYSNVSSLQSVSVNAAGMANVVIDADAPTSDMDALVDVTVVAGEDATLKMEGRWENVQQEQVISVEWSSSPGSFGDAELVLDIPGFGEVTLDEGNYGNIGANNSGDPFFGTGYTATKSVNPDGLDITLTKTGMAGAVPPITIVSFNDDGLIGASVSTEVTKEGNLPGGMDALETVVVEAGQDAYVDLDDITGNFTLDVTAVDDAFIDTLFGNNGVAKTGVTEMTVTVGTKVEYDDEDPNDFVNAGTDIAVLDLEDNASLETLTVSGARTNIDIVGDHTSLTTVDLTGVTEEFSVQANTADYAENGQVRYLIGGTSSEIKSDVGDSQLYLSDTAVEVREIVTFTELDFGTVVINNFVDDEADPDETDRLDVSQLGYTNAGQLDFEEGDYDEETGIFTSGSGEDIRVTDGVADDGVDMSGEIIFINVDADDLQANIIY
ncbi:hypothetical protein [Tateyamaria pelophila]|uniref:hypothetical protein n=1 Tax=Tateyamaria pelophila TaxID=328415 RepID=UPI001CC16D53|nr:hypothetical protein [Tateyamaria pelophila]